MAIVVIGFAQSRSRVGAKRPLRLRDLEECNNRTTGKSGRTYSRLGGRFRIARESV
jgi:hypothetical protein